MLVPTRELAEQVRTVLASLLGPQANRVVAIYGGTGYEPQRRALRRGADIVVACPGRLEDLLATGALRLSGVRTVVLDEADRMVDMGFVKPVCRILDQTSDERQILLFSATIGKEVASISRRYQSRPTEYRIVAEASAAADVSHHFWQTPRTDRVKVTARLVGAHGQAFVFCRTKRSADRVARQLVAEGVAAVPIHGDRSQAQRTRALAAFTAGRTQALVATDVVARGIHVDAVPCVVHFDPPGDADTYLHRSGRTGRVGHTGTVVSLVVDEVRGEVRTIQRQLGLGQGFTVPFADTPRPSPSPPARVEAAPLAAPSPAAVAASDGRLTGTVKFFNAKRGYGFVSGPDGTDVFVHHTKVRRSGAARAALQIGDLVSFDLVPGRRGVEAHDVVGAGRAG